MTAEPPPLTCSAWLTTETGTVHLACAPARALAEALVDRYVLARVGSMGTIGPCCQADDVACAFDTFSDAGDIDAVVLLSHALARAEGRNVDPPYRCSVHGSLTFGGCCG